MRIGMICPYSFDIPGGVQIHILEIANAVSYTHLTLPTIYSV